MTDPNPKPTPTPPSPNGQETHVLPPAGISVSTGDLAFVLQVLIPRVWVRGPEVDVLVELRGKLEEILDRVDRDALA